MWNSPVRCEIGGESSSRRFTVIVPGLEWLRVGFDAEQCLAGTERIVRELGLPQDFYRLEGFKDGGLLVQEPYLYPREEQRAIRFAYPAPRSDDAASASPYVPPYLRAFTFEQLGEIRDLLQRGVPGYSMGSRPATPRRFARQVVSPGEIGGFADFFRAASNGSPSAMKDSCPITDDKVREVLLSEPTREAPAWPATDEPGIYRREHASLLIRSKTTSILVDPSMLWSGYAGLVNAPTNLSRDQFDAIFITHGHEDHWNIPSILYAARDPAVPVFVPHVPRCNILAPDDLSQQLRSFGQAASAVQWWSTVTIGDIEVDILPFYGEQPTRDSPGAAPALRNWGNCYRFNTPEFSALVLVDSGVDPLGSMTDVVRASLRRRGPADVLLTSLPVFLSPFFGGLGNYYLTLPFFRLKELWAQFLELRLPSSTSGPEGVVELCEASGTRHYMTYGNGFVRAGEPIDDVSGTGQPSEAALLNQIGSTFRTRGIRTTPVDWNPGDAVHFQGERARVRRYESSEAR
jgi:L-ascorbate metabolism protein UlaG (beta-lactamase superfamily)